MADCNGQPAPGPSGLTPAGPSGQFATCPSGSSDKDAQLLTQIVMTLASHDLNVSLQCLRELSTLISTNLSQADSPLFPAPRMEVDCPPPHPPKPASKRPASILSSEEEAPSVAFSETNTITGSQADPSNEFQLVTRSRRNKRTKKPATAASSPPRSPPVPLMSSDSAVKPVSASQPAPATASDALAPPLPATQPAPASATNKPATRAAHQPPPSAKPPPPVFLRDKAKYEDVRKLVRDANIVVTKARNMGPSILMETPSIEAFRGLTRLLTQNKIAYHTYALPEERKIRAVLRGVPFELSNEAILNDLVAQGFAAEAVHKMYTSRGRQYQMALVILTNSPSSRDIFKESITVCGLSYIRAERPHHRGPGQCHRCQLYGHAALHCSAPPRCVKCLEPHATAECSRTRDSTDPPACVLCKSVGHTANYKGCPRAPRFPARAANQPHQPAPPPASAFPPLAPPQGPPNSNPGNAWGPRKAALPTPTTAPSAPAQPRPAPTAGRASAPTPQADGTAPSDLQTVYSAIRSINLEEISILAGKLRSARSPQERLLALCEHESLMRSL